MLLALLLTLLVVLAVLVWPKAAQVWAEAGPKPAPAWTESVLQRLEREGARRGRSRRRYETVRRYARALADGVLPDERIAAVGRTLSDAMFAGHPEDPGAEAAMLAVIDDVTAAHPAPNWRERRQANNATTPSADGQPVGAAAP